MLRNGPESPNYLYRIRSLEQCANGNVICLSSQYVISDTKNKQMGTLGVDSIITRVDGH